MNVDVSKLLIALAERAKHYQARLQADMQVGHQQLGRALTRQGRTYLERGEDTESIDWVLRAQVSRARLEEVQSIIEEITRSCAESAMAGRTVA